MENEVFYEIDDSLLRRNARKFVRMGSPKPMKVVLVATLVTILIALMQMLVQFGGISGVLTLIRIELGEAVSRDEAMRVYMAMTRPGGRIIAYLLSAASWMVASGLIMYYMQQTRTRNGGYGSLMDAFPHLLRIIGYEIITGIFTLLWSLLLIIPGIIAAYSYTQGLYLLLDHPEWGIMDCIKESKRLMKGRKFDYFVLGLTFIGWDLLVGLNWIVAGLVTAFGISPLLFEIDPALAAVLSYVIMLLLTAPLLTYVTAYRGFTFFQYYDALHGRLHDPDQPPAPAAPEPPEQQNDRWY